MFARPVAPGPLPSRPAIVYAVPPMNERREEAASPAARLRALIEARDFDAGFDLLYRAHAADVLRFVRSLGPKESLDDVCQNVWIAVRQALPAFRFESSPRVWLFSIARWKTLDAARRARRRPEVPFAEIDTDNRERVIDQLSLSRGPTTPLSDLVRRQRAHAFLSVLEGWEMSDRELLEMRFVAGLKPAQIVEILNQDVSPNAVSQRIVRLARRLRLELLEHDAFASERRRA